MKKIFITFTVFLTIMICSVSCNKDSGYDNHDVSLKIGEVTEIKTGEIVDNTQYGLSLSVKNINVKCPEGSTCWAWDDDYVSVDFHLTTKKGQYDFTLEPPSIVSKNDTVIEGIRYWLVDVFPHRFLEEEQEKTAKILVGGRPMAESQWKLVRALNKETSKVSYYSQKSKPYIIHFKKDFIVEFPWHCNIPQAFYITGNNGYIAFFGFYPCTAVYCMDIADRESLVADNFLQSKKYTIKNNQLTIECEENNLYFEKIEK